MFKVQRHVSVFLPDSHTEDDDNCIACANTGMIVPTLRFLPTHQPAFERDVPFFVSDNNAAVFLFESATIFFIFSDPSVYISLSHIHVPLSFTMHCTLWDTRFQFI